MNIGISFFATSTAASNGISQGDGVSAKRPYNIVGQKDWLTNAKELVEENTAVEIKFGHYSIKNDNEKGYGWGLYQNGERTFYTQTGYIYFLIKEEAAKEGIEFNERKWADTMKMFSETDLKSNKVDFFKSLKEGKVIYFE
ncbi:hypothetical protein A2526_03415 [candidate division WOR-1 bacterium RIFOXYD2_FULL_36_8]|uniref:Uncharacterized protein n=1 Tax=candidate division WOR-1 bacterium RIFOXYB2_FULL_36_35 TaxID=1802578 RepID=A0A1F4S5N7_UNCSA|nr:MAG: hypothetical protein A2230_04905 [candidate division WOR-1 bacterium RIFOXYA2_FULL_36_21]OGC15744.1 MAG: hypothetical protein A2290_05330 [candidate division WOR-1 bacterium RIFOXYB2_FULL_36_35]OGC21099.1 MAG: hypothetical protein A2282_03660 [candidate division WOR-1 bacterium RIFOXYA12_FULL_36_13]OGC41477.1 MAG: hypothetical protein A2526_03415 [candidate division WOR-1 bacterium RIFOXYD2_FULL_36_8]